MFYSINGNLIENFDLNLGGLHSNEYDSAISTVMIEECDNLRSQLSTLFQKYNDAKSSKTQAQLNIENIKKQLIDAEKELDLYNSNISKAAEEYNKILLKLHNLNCSSN